MSERMDELVAAFKSQFGDDRDLCVSRAPGRINLIGEHTDYNNGYVLPIAVDRDVTILFRPIDRPRVELYAANFEQRSDFGLEQFEGDDGAPWAQYPLGVAKLLSERGGELRGLQAVVHGTLPVGGGLSSSAAFCVAAALALCHASELAVEKLELARLCQQAEHRFAGVNCGIMDQYVSLFGQASRAVLLDCRDLTHRLVPFESVDAKLLVFDTGVRHALASSAYNQRREECRQAVEALSKYYPGIQSLRDVSVDEFLDVKPMLPELLRRRAGHVVTENARTLAAARALGARNDLQLGVLMEASHISLRDDYEVSCEELDVLVEIAAGLNGEFGSRMTGGGFGGCAITLVDAQQVDVFAKEVPKLYKDKTGLDTQAYVALAEDGAEVRTL